MQERQALGVHITGDRSNAAIVSSIIPMTKHLGLSFTSKDAETEQELNHLSVQQCDIFPENFFQQTTVC